MTECPRENDVLEAVASTRWPEELRTHSASCPVCSDLAMVAAALHDEGGEARRDAHLPTSGQVWWRATMRTRAEASRAAARPITALQGVAAACAAGASAAVITQSWPSIANSLMWIGNALSTVAVQQALIVAAVLGAGVILTPFVLYLALSDD